MPIEVEVPDVGIVEFPDGMEESQIDTEIRRIKWLEPPAPRQTASSLSPVSTLDPGIVGLRPTVPAQFQDQRPAIVAPDSSLAARVSRAMEETGRSLAPILGPTELQRAEGFKPLGSTIEQQGLVPAMFTPKGGVLPTVGQQGSTLAQAAAGVYNPIAETVNIILASPGGLLTLGLGGELAGIVRGAKTATDAVKLANAAQKTGAAAFAVDIGRNIPDQAIRALKTLDDPNASLQEKIQAAAEPALSAVFTTALGREALAKTKANLYASQNREAAEIHGNVRSQPIEGAREMPPEGRGGGVQPQAPEASKEGRQGVLLTPPAEEGVRLDESIPEISSIDRDTGEVLINPKEYDAWLRTVPEKRRELAVQSLLSEERIHLATDHEDATAYWNTLTAAEKAIARRIYTGRFRGRAEISDLQMAHDALRFRIQQAARMTPREFAEAALKDRIGLQTLDAIGRTIQRARETLGTKASKEGLAIIGRIAENLDAAKAAVAAGSVPRGTEVDEPFAIRKGKKDTSEQGFFFLPPVEKGVERPSAAEVGASLPTPNQISETASKYILGDNPSFERFASQFETAQPGQLRDAWEDAVWKSVTEASGEKLSQMRRDLKLERNVGTKQLADPLTREQEVDPRFRKEARATQNYRKTVQSSIARKLIEQSYEGESLKKALSRPTLSVDDLALSKPNFYRELSKEEAASPNILSRVVSEDFRATQSGKTLPESNTRRVVALVDKSNGEVRLVSAYQHPRRGVLVVDPRAPYKMRPNVPLQSLLGQYRPIATALLDEPIQNFHQKFRSVGEFNDQIANDARNAVQEQAANEASLEKGAGITEPIQEEPSVLEGGQRITPSQAGKMLDSIYDTVGKIESPQDIADTITELGQKWLSKSKVNWDAIAGFQKAYDALKRVNPDATLQDLYEDVYRKASEAKTREAFQARASQSYGGADLGDVRGVEAAPAPAPQRRGTTGRELRALDRPAIPPYPAPEIGRRPKRAFPFEPGSQRKEPAAFNKAKAAAQDELTKVSRSLTAYATRRETVQEMAKLRDKADNTANIIGDQTEKSIRLQSASEKQRQGNPQILSAAKAVVQSGFDLGEVNRFVKMADKAISDATNKLLTANRQERRRQRARLAAAEHLKADAEYARDNFTDPELQTTSQAIHDELQLQFRREVASGSTLQHEENYLPGRYEAELFNDDSVIFGERTDILGRQWRAPKTFKNYWEAIQAGPYIPATYDAASLVGHRVRQGMRQITKRLWVDALKGIADPFSGKPAVDPAVLRPDGSAAPTSPESVVVHIPGQAPLSVRRSFASTVRNLGGVSSVEDIQGLRTALRVAQGLKHTILLGDFFHLGRLSYYAAAIMGRKAGYRGGATALEYRPADLAEAVRKGLVDQKDADWASQPVTVTLGGTKTTVPRGQIAAMAVNEGLNVGRIQDALYKDMVKDVPLLGKYNRWLFDRFTRGLMLESAVHEFERLNAKNPSMDAKRLMRDIARDTNYFFGNIGRQGWFKNPTLQAFTRIAFLAPQWVEGLVMKEAALPGRLSGVSYLLGRRGVPLLGTTGRGIARGLVAMLMLTQAANLITRRKPTWQNEEEGHALDAWIPGRGDSPGAWVSPLSIFNELAHDLIRYLETKPKGWDAVKQIGGNKLGPWGRLGLVLLTSKTGAGKEITTTAGVAKEAAKAMAPVPISFGRLTQAAGAAVAPGLVPPPPPGSVQRQLLGSMGIKSEPANQPGQRISRLAQSFLQKEGLKPSTGFDLTPTDEPSYSALRSALRSGNVGGAQKVYRILLQGRKPEDIVKAMRLWKDRPFTGSKSHERLFLYSLTPDELEAYNQAVLERQQLFEAFKDFYLSQ